MARFHNWLPTVGMLLLLGLVLPGRSWGQARDTIGAVSVVEGTAELKAATSTVWERVQFKDPVFFNDTGRTAAASKLKILLRDSSILTLAEQSEMQFTEFLLADQQRRSVINLLLGKIRLLAPGLLGARSETEVHTPNAVAGIRGSEGHVAYDAGTRQTTLLCVSGDCFLRDPRNLTRVLAVPEGHLAQQIGNILPIQTRIATATERQAITAGTAATEQDPQETQTTEQQTQQRRQEPPGPRRSALLGAGPTGPPPSAVITAGLVPEQRLTTLSLEDRLPSAGMANPQIDLLPSADAGPAGGNFVQEQLRRLHIIITIPR